MGPDAEPWAWGYAPTPLTELLCCCGLTGCAVYIDLKLIILLPQPPKKLDIYFLLVCVVTVQHPAVVAAPVTDQVF